MARPIWKGSISFGLVNIPVSLFAAENRSEIHFRMLDSRNRARVRYERINEATGAEVPWDVIVKGYEYDKGQYVLITDEEMEKVNVEATKTVDIEDFVPIDQIDYLYFDKPYYLEPAAHGEKSYALLARSLEESGKAGLARVVIRTRQHLCAIIAREGRLVMNLLRFPQELRDIAEFKAPDAKAKRNQPSSREYALAEQLIESMTVDWDPTRYHDDYRSQIMEWIQQKIDAGEFEASPPPAEEEAAESPGKLVDLMDYLKRSVEERKSGKTAAKAPAKKAAKKAAAKKATKKTVAKKAAKKVARRKAS